MPNAARKQLSYGGVMGRVLELEEEIRKLKVERSKLIWERDALRRGFEYLEKALRRKGCCEVK